MTDTKKGELLLLLKAKESALHDLLRNRDGITVERSPDPSDEAQFALDRELTIRTLDRDSALLADIRFALQRVDDGSYGLCDCCDNYISEKRLIAIPWAKYCIACQESIDHTYEGEEIRSEPLRSESINVNKQVMRGGA